VRSWSNELTSGGLRGKQDQPRPPAGPVACCGAQHMRMLSATSDSVTCLRAMQDDGGTRFILVENWFEELRDLVEN